MKADPVMKHVQFEVSDGVAKLVLNRPPVNAIDEQMVQDLHDALTLIERTNGIRVLVIRSALTVFSVGADIKMLHRYRGTHEVNRVGKFIENLQSAYSKLENLPIPTVAVINGHALGGGLELALSCDFRLVLNGSALIGLPEVELGMLPGAGGCQRVTRLLGESKAKELIYLGQKLTPKQALDVGLVTKVLDGPAPDQEVQDFIQHLAQKSTVAIAGIKRSIQSHGQMGLETGYMAEVTESLKAFSSHDAAEGFSAFVERRAPQFAGK